MSDNLNGQWNSESGATLSLEVSNKRLTGTYKTPNSPGGAYELNGSVDPNPNLKDRALSFSVAWFNEDGTSPTEYRCVTSYTGQYHKDNDHEEIEVTFLLVDETTMKRSYISTCIGHDKFFKQK